MAKMTKTTQMKAGLARIYQLTSPENRNDATLEEIHRIAAMSLQPITRDDTRHQNKVYELAAFLKDDMTRMMVSHEDLRTMLNSAGIKTITNKDWTTANIQKIMPKVKESLIKLLNAEKARQ